MSDENGSLFAASGSMGSFPSSPIVEPFVDEVIDEELDDVEHDEGADS